MISQAGQPSAVPHDSMPRPGDVLSPSLRSSRRSSMRPGARWQYFPSERKGEKLTQSHHMMGLSIRRDACEILMHRSKGVDGRMRVVHLLP